MYYVHRCGAGHFSGTRARVTGAFPYRKLVLPKVLQFFLISRLDWGYSIGIICCRDLRGARLKFRACL